MSFTYVMSPTGKLFHESDLPVKMICGPYGSGKSCMCAVDVLTYACAQPPAPDGVRYTRVGIIRSTYNELLTTTRKSLLEVFPSQYGTITGGGVYPRGFYQIPLGDGTTVEVELNLLALAMVQDCEKIKSMNWSYVWINEATGIIPEVFAAAQQRVGRYPSKDMGGVGWGGIIMDFNQPAPGTWLHELAKNPPANYLMVNQPPAAFEYEDSTGKKCFDINPEAENLSNLGAREEGDPDTFASKEEEDKYLLMKGMRYYRNQIDTLEKMGRIDVIENQYCMLDVPIIEGKPVFTNFSSERHIADKPLSPIDFQGIIIGSDTSGIHPAAVILQYQAPSWCVLDEMYADGEGLEDFLYGMLIPLLRSKYATCPISACLDPADARDSWTGVTPRERFEEAGIHAVTAQTNAPKARIQCVEHMFNLYTGGLLISPTCSLLIRGCRSEYRYRRMKAAGSLGVVYTPTPEKNDASHICDALQYACLHIMLDKDSQDMHNQTVVALADKRKRMMRCL